MADDVRIRFGAELGDVTSGLAELKSSLQQLNAQLQGLSGTAAGTGKSLDGLSASAGTTGKSLTGLGGAAAAAAKNIYGIDTSAASGSHSMATLTQSTKGMIPVVDQSLGVITGWREAVKKAGDHTEKFSLNTSGARRELIVLAHEMSQGNYSRFGGSMMVLAERAGGVTLAMMGAAGAAAAFGFALYEVVDHAIQANRELDGIRGTMAAMGNSADYSRAGLKAQVAEMVDGYSAGSGAARAMIGTVEAIPAATEPAKRELMQLGYAFARGMGKDDDQARDFVGNLAKAAAGGAGSVRSFGDAFQLFDGKMKVALADAGEFNDRTKAMGILLQGMRARVGDFPEALRQYYTIDPMLGTDAGGGPKYPKASEHFGPAPSPDDEKSYEANRRLIKDTDRTIETLRAGWMGLKTDLDRQEVAKWQAVRKTQGLAHAEILTAEQKLAQAEGALRRDQAAEVMADAQGRMARSDAASGGNRSSALAARLAENRALLADDRISAEQKKQVARDVAQVEAQIAAESRAGRLRLLQEDATATRSGSEERIAAEGAVYAYAVKTWGDTSAQAKAAQDQVSAAVRARAAEQTAIDRESLATGLEVGRIATATERERLDAEVTAGRMTATQKIAALSQITDATYAETLAQLDIEDAGLVQGTKAWEDALRRRAVLVAQYQQDTARLDQQAAQANADAARKTQQAWTEATAPISRAFNGMVGGILQGTQTLGQAAARAAGNMAISFAEAIAGMTAKAAAFFSFEAVGWSQLAKAVNPFVGEGIGGMIGKATGIGQGAAGAATGAAGGAGAQQVQQVVADQAKMTAAVQAGTMQRTMAETTSQTTQTGSVTMGSATRTAGETTSQTTRAGEVTTAATVRATVEAGSQTAQTTAVVAGESTRAGAAAAGQAATAATQKTGVLSHAASTAAAVYDDVAQIPYVGWILAPAAAAVAFAGVAAFGSMISAEGGHESVARDGQLFKLHAKESVLPRQIAQPLMGLAKSGGLEPAALAAPALAAMSKAAPVALAALSPGAVAAPSRMSLPASFAGLSMPSAPALASRSAGGGAGGDTWHVTVQANDAASVNNMLQRPTTANAMVRAIQGRVALGAKLAGA